MQVNNISFEDVEGNRTSTLAYGPEHCRSNAKATGLKGVGDPRGSRLSVNNLLHYGEKQPKL